LETLKNNSTEDIVVHTEHTNGWVFWPATPDWKPDLRFSSTPQFSSSRLIKAGETMENIDLFGNDRSEWLLATTYKPGIYVTVKTSTSCKIRRMK